MGGMVLTASEIGSADLEVILTTTWSGNGPSRELELGHGGLLLGADVEHEATVADRQFSDRNGAFAGRHPVAGD